MTGPPTSVGDYLARLDPERRAAVEAIRAAINARLPEGYGEGVQYGMIGWYVPHSIYPAGYHCDPREPVPFVGLGAQKAHLSLHLFCVYVDPTLHAWFVGEYAKTGKRLDMGKSCVRFRRLDDVPLDLLGETVARMPVGRFLAAYTAALPAPRKKKKAT